VHGIGEVSWKLRHMHIRTHLHVVLDSVQQTSAYRKDQKNNSGVPEVPTWDPSLGP
jgi:hypothetical protein